MTTLPRPCPSSASLRTFAASCSGQLLLMTGVSLPASANSFSTSRSWRRAVAVSGRKPLWHDDGEQGRAQDLPFEAAGPLPATLATDDHERAACG